MFPQTQAHTQKNNVRSWKNIILNKGSKFLVGMEGGRKEDLKRRTRWKEHNWALKKRAKHEENQKVVLHCFFNYSLELVQTFISFRIISLFHQLPLSFIAKHSSFFKWHSWTLHLALSQSASNLSICIHGKTFYLYSLAFALS